MDPKKQFYETLATSMIEKFKKRQIDAYYCATKEEAVALATSMHSDTDDKLQLFLPVWQLCFCHTE